ncbi:MAG: glycosyltransferase [Ruminococcus sp.]|nr:glycosyltransferase [Ruminococcus sp.]
MLEMKNIMFVTATLGGGGAERVMLNLANYMADCGNNVVVFCTAPRIKNEYPLNEKVKTIFLETDKKNKALKIIDKIGKIRSVFKAYPGYTLVSFFPDINMYTVIADMGLKNKVILSERNDPARMPTQKYLRALRNVIYEFCDEIVFQTHDASKYFSKRIQKKGTVIYNPVNDGMPEPFNGEKEKVVIAVGRLSPQKNYFMLIDAFEKFHRRHPDWKLEIYGRGKRQHFIDYINEHKLNDCVLLFEHSNNIYDHVRECQIYASSSDFEGMSNTMLEAMALGTAAVVTDCPVGGAREVMKDHVSGLIVPVGDSDAMAEAFEELDSNRTLMNNIVKNALYVRKELSVEEIAQRWIERM